MENKKQLTKEMINDYAMYINKDEHGWFVTSKDIRDFEDDYMTNLTTGEGNFPNNTQYVRFKQLLGTMIYDALLDETLQVVFIS